MRKYKERYKSWFENRDRDLVKMKLQELHDICVKIREIDRELKNFKNEAMDENKKRQERIEKGKLKKKMKRNKERKKKRNREIRENEWRELTRGKASWL